MIYYLKVSRWWLISKAAETICKDNISTAKDDQDHKTFGTQNTLLCPEMSTFLPHLVAVSGRAVNGRSFRECWAQCLWAFTICRVWKVIQNQLTKNGWERAIVHSSHQCQHQPMLLSDKSGECNMPEGQNEWLIMGSFKCLIWFVSFFLFILHQGDSQGFGEMSYRKVSFGKKEQTESKQR